MGKNRLPAFRRSQSLSTGTARRLTDEQFHRLSNVPAVTEWLANIENSKTRRAYRADLQDFVRFVGIAHPDEFGIVTRAHLIAWRKSLEDRNLKAATIRRKLSAIGSLYDYLCEKNAVASNPVDGVKRPSEGLNEGKTPGLSADEAARLLDAPSPFTLKGKRDRAILSVFLFHALRSNELSRLCVRDVHRRQGIVSLRIHGKRSKIRYLEAHPKALSRITDYLASAGHGDDADGALFRPIRNSRGHLNKPLTATAIYECVVLHYAKKIGLVEPDFCVHSLRATAATNALENGADIADVQRWLGHANISTTRLYDRRKTKPDNSPTFKVRY